MSARPFSCRPDCRDGRSPGDELGRELRTAAASSATMAATGTAVVLSHATPLPAPCRQRYRINPLSPVVRGIIQTENQAVATRKTVSAVVLITDEIDELKTFKNDKNQRTNKTQPQPRRRDKLRLCVCPSATTLTDAFLDRFSPKLAQT